MFCMNCGQKLQDGEKFCPKCGTAVEHEQTGDGSGFTYESYRSLDGRIPDRENIPSGMKLGMTAFFIILAVLLLMVPAGIVVYLTAGLNGQKNRLVSVIEEAEIPEYEEQEKTIAGKWNKLNITDVWEKKYILGKLEQICADVEKFHQCIEEIGELEDAKEQYNLEGSDSGGYSYYEKILDECTEAAEKRRAREVFQLLKDAKKCQKELVEANDIYIEDMIHAYKEADLSGAGQKETVSYEKYMDKLQKLVSEDEKDYQAIGQIFQKMNKTVGKYAEPVKLLEMNVQQVDVAGFPKVKLYLRVLNPASGEVPDNLDGGMFYVRKENANAQYVKQKVTNVSQLDETEVLKVDMVADVSGSMSGQPIQEAKESMSNFIRSVQFSAGDMVELTSFSTGVRLEQEFCGDEGLLLSKINDLYTGDSTSLYDALYTAVERTAAQSGARCVMAFTDGQDNYSDCTRDDVVDAAQRYHVPVFIIGIGDADYSDASYIAQQTGGVYYNIHDVYSMESIYDEIYQMEKDLFLVEFKDNTGAAVSDVSNIETGYHSIEYGGSCSYSYTPNVLLNVRSSSFYQDGPEAVVERYLRGFADAVTESDFSYISDCLKPGSAIYKEQQSYVLRDIEEQLDSFEIVSVDYSGGQNCVVLARETYFVQVSGQPLQLMTQECQYALEETGGQWKMTAFVGKVRVLSRIRQ